MIDRNADEIKSILSVLVPVCLSIRRYFFVGDLNLFTL